MYSSINKSENLHKQQGITLIALVVTIVVLLILAGVSISMLSGDDGIIKNAQMAKKENEEAALEEKIKLLASETLINQYTGENEEKTAQELQKELNDQGENVLVVQWDKYIIFDLNQDKEYRVMSDGSFEYWGESTMGKTLLNTKTANVDQISQKPSTSNIIGIDNEGNTVNMLLWEYTLIEDESLGKVGTYGLNDKEALTGSGNNRSAGYLGGYTEDGKITGTVPAYISVDSGNTYIGVTSMAHTFYDCDELIVAPEIANTVTNMMVAFYQSSKLTTAPSIIPDSVINLNYTFSNCEKLNTVPTVLGKNIETMKSTFSYTAISEFNTNLPSKIIDMSNTFRDCTSLMTFTSILPDSVIYMNSTFRNCTALTTAPEIPNSVINMSATFYKCTSLIEGPTIIPNKVTNMQSTFFDCASLTTAPTIIPSSVINMFQTFGECNNLEGTIQINANLDGKIVYNWNGRDYKDYEQCFVRTSITGNGLIISRDSECAELENLLETKSPNSNITIEE